jgi:uncharacterized protein
MRSLPRGSTAILLGLLALAPGAGHAEDLEAATAARLGDYSAAVARWQTFAQQGDADSAYHLGEAYETGHGVPRDMAQADYWLRVAATNGSGAADYALGLRAESTERPDGTPQDLSAAIGWYQRALEAGDPRARERLAALGAGDSRPGNERPANERPTNERPAPSPPFGAETTPVVARPPETHSAEPHPPAPTPAPSAGEIFDRAVADWRSHGIDSTNSSTIAALETAAMRGEPLAQYDLAYAYEHGLGVPAEPAKAYAWYKRARASASAPARLHDAAETNMDLLAAKLSDGQKQAADRLITR